jgi:eukaryotic-like serine/threonine-protein kinase
MRDSAADALLPRTGDLILGRYRIEGTLGRGGSGVVFAVRHEMLGQRAALKVMADVERDDASRRGFLHDARAALQIRSNHVVNVKDIGALDTGLPFVLMELLEGRDVAQILKENGPLPIAQSVDYAVQALEALSAAHAISIVHRDLKPSNLFVTTDPNAPETLKVLGFGVAPSQAPMGVALYLSPEQLRSDQIDARTDIWAIGVILHELLTGSTPFARETFGAIVDQPITPISERREDVPKGLEHVIFRCLERDPAARYPDVGELARALAPFGTVVAQSQIADIEANLAIAPPPTTLPGGHAAPDEPASPFDKTLALMSPGMSTVFGASPLAGTIARPGGAPVPRPDVRPAEKVAAAPAEKIPPEPNSERTLIMSPALAAARNLPPPEMHAPLPHEGPPPYMASSGPPGGPPPIGPPPPGYVSPSAPGAWIAPRAPTPNRNIGLLAAAIGGAVLVLIVGAAFATRAVMHRRAAAAADAGIPVAAASDEPSPAPPAPTDTPPPEPAAPATDSVPPSAPTDTPPPATAAPTDSAEPSATAAPPTPPPSPPPAPVPAPATADTPPTPRPPPPPPPTVNRDVPPVPPPRPSSSAPAQGSSNPSILEKRR